MSDAVKSNITPAAQEPHTRSLLKRFHRIDPEVGARFSRDAAGCGDAAPAAENAGYGERPRADARQKRICISHRNCRSSAQRRCADSGDGRQSEAD